MTSPSVELDLGKVGDNAAALVDLLGRSGLSLTGVTKAAMGQPEYANALLDAGVRTLADSRVENVERMRTAGIDAPVLLLRSPMLSQVDRVVASADVSCNTEMSILGALSRAATAASTNHGIMLMVELGDLREGILPKDLCSFVESMLPLRNLTLKGLGTNLACRSGIVPDERNMNELSELADLVETSFGITLDTVSGGNSANVDWLLTEPDVGRINDLRLGEAVLLGCEPLHRRPVPGLHTDAAMISAEVIESKWKPTRPTGTAAQAAFGEVGTAVDRGEIWQTIVAIGHQDTDPDGLTPPPGISILGASSDHLVLETPCRVPPTEVIQFIPTYGALVRAMTSPYVAKTWTERPAGRPDLVD